MIILNVNDYNRPCSIVQLLHIVPLPRQKLDASLVDHYLLKDP